MVEKLTARQEEIFQLVKMGNTNREIAQKLNIVEVTVEKTLTEIYRKLGIGDDQPCGTKKRLIAILKSMGLNSK